MPLFQEGRLRSWEAAVMHLFGRNLITMFGASITTVSAVLLLALLLVAAAGFTDSPYVGIMAFMVLPGVFMGGLALIPVGLIWERLRGRSTAPGAEGIFPILDFNEDRVRRMTIVVALLTVVNLFIISGVSYEGMHFMDSTQFCGQVCHTVMKPEHTAYVRSPHSRVECVECHIGPGAPWFVKAKLSGLRQVLAVATHSYATPIATPVENLRPSRDTCEQCHWPERFSGDRMKIYTRYGEDEENTPTKTVLLMHIGGGEKANGIHSWHVNPEKKTTYIAVDDKRQEIAQVRVQEADGTVLEFKRDGVEIPADAKERVMDCIDCHNRPTHIYQLPKTAMDDSMASGRISDTLPFIKKMGVEVLTAVAEEETDAAEVSQRLQAYYESDYAELYTERRVDFDAAIQEIQAIFDGNVFPDMKVTWGTYPSHLGHEQSPGCFRCHDDDPDFATADGTTIPQDCETCHALLAWEEEDPEIMEQLQLQ
jgi:hypothetical protein